MLEAVGAYERFIDDCQNVPVLGKSGANSVEVTKRRKELERARNQALVLKQLQQPPGPGLDDALAHQWRDDRASVDQQFGARRAGEDLFSVRVEAVAIGARGDSQQAALIVVALPGKQRGIFSQQLLLVFGVVVVNDASRLCYRPLQSAAKAFSHFSGEVLPAGVAVLTCDHELRVALRQGQVNVWQLRPRSCDRVGGAGGDVARKFLCLFTEGFERRTSGKGFRCGHCDLLS